MISDIPYVHSHWPANVLKLDLAKPQVENVKKEQRGTAVVQSLCSVGCFHASSGERILKTASC